MNCTWYPNPCDKEAVCSYTFFVKAHDGQDIVELLCEDHGNRFRVLVAQGNLAGKMRELK